MPATRLTVMGLLRTSQLNSRSPALFAYPPVTCYSDRGCDLIGKVATKDFYFLGNMLVAGVELFSLRAQPPQASTAYWHRLSSHPRSDRDGEPTTW